jgi:hypothetical protein
MYLFSSCHYFLLLEQEGELQEVLFLHNKEAGSLEEFGVLCFLCYLVLLATATVCLASCLHFTSTWLRLASSSSAAVAGCVFIKQPSL